MIKCNVNHISPSGQALYEFIFKKRVIAWSGIGFDYYQKRISCVDTTVLFGKLQVNWEYSRKKFVHYEGRGWLPYSQKAMARDYGLSVEGLMPMLDLLSSVRLLEYKNFYNGIINQMHIRILDDRICWFNVPAYDEMKRAFCLNDFQAVCALKYASHYHHTNIQHDGVYFFARLMEILAEWANVCTKTIARVHEALFENGVIDHAVHYWNKKLRKHIHVKDEFMDAIGMKHTPIKKAKKPTVDKKADQLDKKRIPIDIVDNCETVINNTYKEYCINEQIRVLSGDISLADALPRVEYTPSSNSDDRYLWGAIKNTMRRMKKTLSNPKEAFNWYKTTVDYYRQKGLTRDHAVAIAMKLERDSLYGIPKCLNYTPEGIPLSTKDQEFKRPEHKEFLTESALEQTPKTISFYMEAMKTKGLSALKQNSKSLTEKKHLTDVVTENNLKEKEKVHVSQIEMSCYLPEKEFEELKPTVSKKESVQSVTNCHHVKQIVGARLHPKTLIPDYKSKDPVLNDLIGKLKANVKQIAGTHLKRS